MPPDGRRHEILDGEWVVTPAPNTKHQTVSKRLQFELMLQLAREDGTAFVVVTHDTQLAERCGRQLQLGQ